MTNAETSNCRTRTRHPLLAKSLYYLGWHELTGEPDYKAAAEAFKRDYDRLTNAALSLTPLAPTAETEKLKRVSTIEVGPIFGMTWEELNRRQLKK